MRGLMALGAALLLAGSAQAGVGFETASAPVPGDKPLAVTIWYPTDAAERQTPLGLYTQSAASGAAPAGRGHPLVVISHGTGGSNIDHYDTARALVAAGFVVAAPTHTGDTQGDRTHRAAGVRYFAQSSASLGITSRLAIPLSARRADGRTNYNFA